MAAAILILLILVFLVFVLPIAAVGKASEAQEVAKSAKKKLKEVEKNAWARVNALERRIDELESRLGESKIGEVVDEEVPELVLDAHKDDDELVSLLKEELESEEVPAVAMVPDPPVELEPLVESVKVPVEVAAEARGESIEMKLGTYWFVRIGVVLLLTGAGILAYYKKQFFIDLTPGAKVAGLYGLSALMGGIGFWLQRVKEVFKNYGQVLLAGGVAGVYFTTYAAHILEPVRVIPDPTVALLLLLVWGGFIVWVADRLKSETIALFAIGASYYATYVPLIHSGMVSNWVILASNVILAVAASAFMWRNRWLRLPVLSMAAGYVGFVIWRTRVFEQPSLDLVLLFVGSLWVVFTAAVFFSKHESFGDRRRAMFLTSNNAALFALGAWEVLRFYREDFWMLPTVVGGLLLGLALLARRMLPEQFLSRRSYLTQGLVLLALGLVTSHLSDSIKGPMFAAESVVLLVLSTRLKHLILQCASFATAGLALIYGFGDLVNASDGYLLSCAGIGLFFLFNSWWCHRSLEVGGEGLLRERVGLFAGAGISLGGSALVFFGQAEQLEWLPVFLMLLSVLLVGTIYFLKVREIAIIGVLPAVVGMVLGVEGASGLGRFTWPLGVLFVLAVGFAHWWRWQ